MSSRLSSTKTSSTTLSARTIAIRSPWLKTGSRPFLRRLSASAETPTTRRSPSAAARSITRRCPTWNTSKVPKVITVRGGMAPLPYVPPWAMGENRGDDHDLDARRPIAMITPDPAADALRRRGLRRMRTLAVSLLASPPWSTSSPSARTASWGFVNAGAEASMVGAIADWFAVTALFKHPLGLPVPAHRPDPRRKDELGRSLEEFVGENFLQETVIRERIASAEHLAAGRASGSPSRPTYAAWSTRSRRSPRSGWARSATSTSPTSSPRR